jgi:hypothetical protein
MGGSMKGVLALMVLVFSLSASAAITKVSAPAQPATEAIIADMPAAAPAAFVRQGVRVAYLQPIMKFAAKTDESGWELNERVDRANGISVGYANLPIGQLGYTSNFALIGMRESGLQQNIVRTDANAAYAWSNNINVKGGVNLSRFVGGDLGANSKPRIGYQMSAGYQMTSNIGADVALVEMRQTGNRDFEGLYTRVRGAELSLNATF